MRVPTTEAIKILDKNPYRILYSIQNLSGANFISLGTGSTVTAGLYGVQEGQHLAAGQAMSDDMDRAEVWGRADTDIVYISVVEISEMPEENPGRHAQHLRPKERRELRVEERTF